ncbi:MAG: class I SAM-dependent methyltransferase [Lachnospiraceae bacterium]|mgnify:CR=1 FL=1|jgi:Methylase involved in ubiquinone/menaquinone biosynthesis|nr:class I SAM-dependent methyltransferase [Lachnospiraceae bacterium]
METDNSNIYSGFAYVYDSFMDNIPYKDWYNYIHGILLDYNIKDGIITELACGTGTISALLAEGGYDVTGVDISSEMLEVARSKCPDSVLLLQQDIRGLDLYGSSAAMVCVCDGMNYLLNEDSLYKTLCRVRMFLDHGGIFIFDMKTRYFYENVLGSRVIAENREDSSLIWENEFHNGTDINEYLITVYNLVDKENDLFERFDELHMQRAYPVEKVKELINKAGLETAAVYNAFTKEEPSGTSERIYFVAKRV